MPSDLPATSSDRLKAEAVAHFSGYYQHQRSNTWVNTYLGHIIYLDEHLPESGLDVFAMARTLLLEQEEQTRLPFHQEKIPSSSEAVVELVNHIRWESLKVGERRDIWTYLSDLEPRISDGSLVVSEEALGILATYGVHPPRRLRRRPKT